MSNRKNRASRVFKVKCLAALSGAVVFSALSLSTAQAGYVLVDTWGQGGQGQGQFNQPTAIEIGQSGTVYVVDTGNHRIQMFTERGRYLDQWGERGNGNAQFEFPEGIAFNDIDNTVYVSDTGNHRIQKFSENGAFRTSWGNFGNWRGEFNLPRGLAFDSQGMLYVADYLNNRIVKYNGSVPQAVYGPNGLGLNRPFDVSVDTERGRIYVADYENGRILKLNTRGEMLSQGVGFNRPKGVEVDDAGDFYVAETGGDLLKVFDPSDRSLLTLGPEGFNRPQGTVVSSSGYIYVTDTRNNRVVIYAKDSDSDWVADPVDNCPSVRNPDQRNTDGSGSGDLCDFDIDDDRVQNNIDNCLYRSNQDQRDSDGDGIGDACDLGLRPDGDIPRPPNFRDSDGDGVPDIADNCPGVRSLDRSDSDGDGTGDACEQGSSRQSPPPPPAPTTDNAQPTSVTPACSKSDIDRYKKARSEYRKARKSYRKARRQGSLRKSSGSKRRIKKTRRSYRAKRRSYLRARNHLAKRCPRELSKLNKKRPA